MFFRPLGKFFFLVLYECFHLDPAGYHIVALFYHALNGCLIILVMRKLGGTLLTAGAVGLLYVCAALVHGDPLYWAVGIYDLLGATFFLASLYFYLCNKNLGSTMFYLAAILTKEATIVLPLILLSYDFLLRTSAHRTKANLGKDHMRTAGLHWGLGLLFAAIEAIHLVGAAGLSPDSMYSINFLGTHVLTNLADYTRWSAEGLFPEGLFEGMQLALILGVGVLACFYQLKNLRTDWRTTAFFAGWFLIGLLPVLPLTHHSFRYYATYSLPPFFAFLIFPMNHLRGRAGRIVQFVAVGFLILNLVSNALFIKRMEDHALNLSSIEGSNVPWRKAIVTDIVADFLRTRRPHVEDSTLIVTDFWPGYFGVNAGPCIWYNKPSIRVVSHDDVKWDSTGFYYDDSTQEVTLEDTPKSGIVRYSIPSNPTKIFNLKWNGGNLTAGAVRFSN
jgi:hypothetical protein